MEIILPSTGKRVHVGVIKSMYIYMHLYLSRHFLTSSIFKSFSRSRIAHNVGMAAAFGLIMIAGLTIIPFSSSSLNAAPGTANPSNTTLTMVLSHENADLTILPSAASGTFGTSTDAETAKFNVTTDNFTGYTLSLKGTDDTKQLVNTTTSSVLDSIATTTTAAAFDTDTYNNKWGFLPNKYNSTTNADYIPAPTTSAVATLDTTSTANNTAIDYSLGLGARIDINKPAGDYTNTFVLTAVGNPIHYVVNFNKNTTDSVDDMPVALDASTTATSIKIPSTTPTRAHYAFTGWCLGTTSTTDGVDTCTDGASGSGTTFQPGDDFGIDQTTANTTTLYAMWRIDTVTVTLTAGTGIDTVAITGSGVKTGGAAGATSTAEVYYNGEITITATLTTTYRFDNWTGDTTYTANPQTISNVSSNLSLTANALKIDMIQNLAASRCITASPTEVYDTRDEEIYTVQRLADGKCWMTQNLRLGYNSTNPNTATMTLSSEDTNIAVDTSFTTYDALTYGDGLCYGDGIPASQGTYNNACIHSGSDKTSGVFYNIVAASAGTVKGSTNVDVTQDICPKGWKLPTKADYDNIVSELSIDATTFNPTMAGSIHNATFSSSYSGWWASTTYSYPSIPGYTSYHLGYDSNNFEVRYSGRQAKYSIRCILDDTKTMQEFSASDASAMATNEAQTLKDSRDGQKYTVTKLSDGNVWMTQNLRFTGTELTPADTNVNSDVTMSYIDFGGGQNYTDAQLRNSNDVSKGVWYNFVAASAGTITGNSNSNNATQDICPKGWRLPTGAEQSALVSAIGSSPASFSPVTSNIVYPDGSLKGYADWWSSSAFSSTNRYTMVYNGSTLSTYTSDGRYYGFFIRCIYDKAVDMQNINYDDLNAMVPTAGSTTTLKDNRDDELYTVSKLGDGNVWMTQNLRFTGTELTPANTNVTSNVTMSYGNITPGYSYDQALIGKSDNSEYGVYYNYAAASAMSVTGSSNSTDATQDICPAGWRLPNNAEINAVVPYKAQFRPVFTGYYANGTYRDANGGYWWASTTASATERYRLYFTSSSYNIIANVRSLGEPVRCIYNKTAIMQNFTTADADAMVTGETKILTDVRDNIDYTVAKLADGQVWMTQNLRFTGTSLNSVTSNVPDSYTEASPLTLTYYDLQSQGSSSSGKCYGNGDSYANGNIYLCKKEGVDNNGDPTVWYNYPAATAGTITDANAADGIYSICPKGWRLPTAAEEANIAGDVANFKPVYGGYYVRGTLVDQTTAGLIWTATASPTYSRMNLYIRYQDGALSIRDSGGRFGGWYIRCVQKNNRPLSSITNMQDITSDIVTNTPDGSTHTMVDTRDGQEYTVAKINGTLWMTRNLAIGCDGSGSTYGSNYAQKTLTSEKSNVATDFTTSITSLSNGNSRAVAYQDCSATYGAWYNYVALSAGTITNGATGTQTYDICPKGWRLPTYTEETAILSQRDIFKPQLGGYWYNGSLIHPELGVWVGSTYSQSGYRYEMYYTDGDSNLATSYGGIPDYGAYARCVAK